MSKVGNETMPDTGGAGLDRTSSSDGGRHGNSPVGHTSLVHAVGHLQAEHPIGYDNLGPHHGELGRPGHMTKHLPLGGMKPGGRI